MLYAQRATKSCERFSPFIGPLNRRSTTPFYNRSWFYTLNRVIFDVNLSSAVLSFWFNTRLPPNWPGFASATIPVSPKYSQYWEAFYNILHHFYTLLWLSMSLGAYKMLINLKLKVEGFHIQYMLPKRVVPLAIYRGRLLNLTKRQPGFESLELILIHSAPSG